MAGKLEYFTKSLLNRPLLATEETVIAAAKFLENRWNFQATDGEMSFTTPSTKFAKGKGIAQIDFYGPMISRAMGMSALCDAKGYDDYRAMFDSAFNDPSIHTVVMAFSSGGGDSAGLFDLAQHVYDEKKATGTRLIAYVEDRAASAAYAMASVADEVIMEKTASVGSIGVVTVHEDHSKALKKAGIVVTPIFAGEFKVAGNPYESLSKETQAMIQERVDGLYQFFVSHVAQMRGIAEADVRATQARMYLADKAIELKLADKIMSTDEFVAYLENGGDSMDYTTKNKTSLQEQGLGTGNVSMSEFEALKAELADLQGLKEKVEAEFAEAKAILAEKAEAEKLAKLEAFKAQAEGFESFGLDAAKFAEYAMSADEGFLNMVTSALTQARATVEASEGFTEIGLDAVGTGVEEPVKESAAMQALKAMKNQNKGGK